MTTEKTTEQTIEQSPATAKSVSVKIDPEIKSQLDVIKDELGLTWNDLFSHLISQYQQQKPSTLQFSKEEENLIGEATKTGISQDELYKTGILSEAKKRVSLADTFNLEDMTDETLFSPNGTQDGKSLKTIAGIGEERVNRTVKAVMAINDKATEKSQKSCITCGLIFNLCGANRATINKYFESYKVMIEDHNFKHGLSPNDNRKGTGFNWYIQLAELEHNLGIENGVITTLARLKNQGNK